MLFEQLMVYSFYSVFLAPIGTLLAKASCENEEAIANGKLSARSQLIVGQKDEWEKLRT
jgi:hypothetical protein